MWDQAFEKAVNDFKPLAISTKRSILYVWMNTWYTSDILKDNQNESTSLTNLLWDKEIILHYFY